MGAEMVELVNELLLSLAYHPERVYAAIVVLMLLSSFGLPIPEEVTLLSAGFIAYVGRSPEEFPPPAPDAPVVDPLVLAAVATGAVFMSDLLIYGIGRRWGSAVRNSWLSRRLTTPRSWERVERWTGRHGFKVCWIFRFTPGVRFPGHLTCGIVKVPLWQFCLADGVATVISVPTQVLLIAYYGDAIVSVLKELKIGLASVLIGGALLYLVVGLVLRRRRVPTVAPEAAP